MKTPRPRILSVIIQPVVVLDHDGESLTPGPEFQAIQVPYSVAQEVLEGLPEQICELLKDPETPKE